MNRVQSADGSSDRTYKDEIVVAFREAMAVELRGFFGADGRDAERFASNFYEQVYMRTYPQDELMNGDVR